MNNDKPSDEQIEKWREEARTLFQNRIGMKGLYDHIQSDCYVGGYITACKKRQEEIVELRGDLKIADKQVNKYLTLIEKSSSISEFQKLKEEISGIHEMYRAINLRRSKSIHPQLLGYIQEINNLKSLLLEAKPMMEYVHSRLPKEAESFKKYEIWLNKVSELKIPESKEDQPLSAPESSSFQNDEKN